MKTLYIDCGMGAAGDMLSAALLELLPDPERFVERLNSLGIPGVHVTREKAVKCGITGTHLRVEIHGQEEGEAAHGHPHHHSHSGMEEIEHLVGKLPIPTMVKLDVLAVYRLIAQAESKVHGVPVSQVHFHEVGAMDAVADITAVCLLLRELDPDRIVASAVHVGSGTVRCAHGILPVPAPATADLLRGIPIYSGEISGELCTPTGAALLKHFVTEFGPMPSMEVDAIGYGMGKKDFPRANCVRVLLGKTPDREDRIVKLECNVDDMTGEALGFALERLMELGALDVFTIPIGMKKSRPGTLLCVLCRAEDKERMTAALFRHTTTLGVREQDCRRSVLQRRVETVDSPYGPVRKKVSTGYGVRREKYENADLVKIAREQDMSLEEILENLKKQ